MSYPKVKMFSDYPADITIRPVLQSDMDSVIEMLQSLSEFRPLKSEYIRIWNDFRKQNNVYSLVAILDNQVVGYGSIVIETKIRGGKMGHIEDVVAHSRFQKRGIGKAIVGALSDIAKAYGCYKVGLQCKEHNVKFYEECGYKVSGLAMQVYIERK